MTGFEGKSHAITSLHNHKSKTFKVDGQPKVLDAFPVGFSLWSITIRWHISVFNGLYTKSLVCLSLNIQD
jgi:hypothetical protein